ncbi:hypothetical protein DPMN_089452 [Dreissena polymorpha]|uniref:Uncharacterized protein n=1 Tax=Dreissena polymorpha TaxID=45954 RepID=A0A9D4KXW2_DREPO|nr:hypothetical protein DPMN_089452 [Dreissena polymorpha]
MNSTSIEFEQTDEGICVVHDAMERGRVGEETRPRLRGLIPVQCERESRTIMQDGKRRGFVERSGKAALPKKLQLTVLEEKLVCKVEGPILVYSRDPCTKITGTRRGNLSKPPTAPKGNIRMSKDNCAFEVRVEFKKKTLSPTLKDNREEIRQTFAFIEARTRAKTRTRKIAAKRAARLTSQK